MKSFADIEREGGLIEPEGNRIGVNILVRRAGPGGWMTVDGTSAAHGHSPVKSGELPKSLQKPPCDYTIQAVSVRLFPGSENSGGMRGVVRDASGRAYFLNSANYAVVPARSIGQVGSDIKLGDIRPVGETEYKDILPDDVVYIGYPLEKDAAWNFVPLGGGPNGWFTGSARTISVTPIAGGRAYLVERPLYKTLEKKVEGSLYGILDSNFRNVTSNTYKHAIVSDDRNLCLCYTDDPADRGEKGVYLTTRSDIEERVRFLFGWKSPKETGSCMAYWWLPDGLKNYKNCIVTEEGTLNQVAKGASASRKDEERLYGVVNVYAGDAGSRVWECLEDGDARPLTGWVAYASTTDRGGGVVTKTRDGLISDAGAGRMEKTTETGDGRL